MNVINRMLSRGHVAASAPLPIKERPFPVNYGLSTFKWHLDSRKPSKAILLHDLFGSSAYWQMLLHESLGRLPCSGLTPLVPLELFAVDFRGHNHSKSLPCPEEGRAFTMACAADIMLLQQQVLRADAKLVGIGFGALVACQAALHSPESGIDSLVLIVNGPSDLLACEPARYSLPSFISDIPKEISSVADLEHHLHKRVPNEAERALILSTVEQREGTVGFKFNETLFQFRGPLCGFSDVGPENIFTKPVTVIQCGSEEFSGEAKSDFMKHFPKAKFVLFEGDRSGGISGLSAQGPAVTRTLLEAMELLGETTGGEE